MKVFRLWLGLAFAVSLMPVRLFAVGSGGIANESLSAESLSNLLGVTGTKTDPMAVYNNPASMSDLGRSNTSIGAMYFNTHGERKGANGTSDTMKTGSVVVPNFATVVGLGNLAVGFAVISPYGLETEWSETSNVRYVATKSRINMLDITPAVSYRVSPQFSFGAGADYYSTFDADLQKKVPVDVVNFVLGFPTLGAPDANSRLSGDGEAWGYHTGLLYNPTAAHTFGVAYHSEVKTKIEGDLELTGLSGASAAVFGGTDFKTRARTDLFYPQHVQFGYKYDHDDKWQAGFNVAWYDWSSNKQLEIQLPDATPTQRAIAGQPVPLQWRDVWSVSIGGFYQFTEAFKLNLGAYYLPAVYPESTFSPAVPDLDKIGISVGPSYTRGSWSLDSVYSPVFYRKTTINNSVGQSSTGLASADISGEYEAIVHIIGVNVRYKYGG